MTNFQSNQGPLEDIFLNDYELLERKAGIGTLWVWGPGRSFLFNAEYRNPTAT